jgi:hypothetical protein
MDDAEYYEGEVLEDVEIYEDEPDFPGHMWNENGHQDDEVVPPVGFGFLAKVTNAIRTTLETLLWFRTHQTTAEIGFNPDGMCLKVARTARNIMAKYLTARESQEATPLEYRVFRVRDFRKGMVFYADDPNDDNDAGHIATIVGRVHGFDPTSLHDVLMETNSVKAGEVVVVRGDYFERHWGDRTQFAATYLNGIVLDVHEKFEQRSKVEKFHDTAPKYKLALLKKAADNGREHAGRVLDLITRQVNQLPDHPKFVRVNEFKARVRRDKILDMTLLNEAVADRGGRDGKIKRVRDEIRRLIDTLPDE